MLLEIPVCTIYFTPPCSECARWV